MSNDIATLINDLDAGVFAEKLATAISKNAMAVVDTGKVSEEDTTTTPMHVGRGGKLSFYPENQMDLLKQSQLGTEA